MPKSDLFVEAQVAQGLHPQQMTVAIAKSIKAKSSDRLVMTDIAMETPNFSIRAIYTMAKCFFNNQRVAVQTNILVAKRAFLTPWHSAFGMRQIWRPDHGMAWTRGLCRRLLLECGTVPSWYGTERLKASSMPKKSTQHIIPKGTRDSIFGRVLVPYFSIFSWFHQTDINTDTSWRSEMDLVFFP